MLQKENEKQHTNLFGNLLNNKKDFINGSAAPFEKPLPLSKIMSQYNWLIYTLV